MNASENVDLRLYEPLRNDIVETRSQEFRTNFFPSLKNNDKAVSMPVRGEIPSCLVFRHCAEVCSQKCAGSRDTPMENLDEPFLDGRRARGRSKCWHCAATIFFVLSSVALAVALALTWIEELPCTTTNQSNKTTFPSDWIRFFHVADIHYDPEYESNVTSRPTYCRANQNAVTAATTALYGRIGCDSPASLVQNAVKAMKTEDETVDFIVVTGDLSAHNLFNETVLHAIQFVTDQLRETFPTTYVFPCLGNNDVPADYYIPTPPTNWYEDVLTLWKGFILCSSCLWRSGVTPTTESSLRQTFLTGGYYRVSLSSKLTLLVLNTVYYSVTVKSQYRTPLFEKTAEGQLTWLAEQLADAEKDGKRAIIAGHVPPGYSTISSHVPIFLIIVYVESIPMIYLAFGSATPRLDMLTSRPVSILTLLPVRIPSSCSYSLSCLSSQVSCLLICTRMTSKSFLLIKSLRPWISLQPCSSHQPLVQSTTIIPLFVSCF